MNNIYVDNVILSSDLTGSLVSVSYSGSDAADFEANAFEFFYITDSQFYLLNVMVLNILQSEMNMAQFNHFIVANSTLVSVAGIQQSNLIKVNIANSAATAQRQLIADNMTIFNTSFVNARLFSVEP